MALAQLQFFDMSVLVTPPGGNLEPLPVLLGPNWRPNDLRLAFFSGSGSGSASATLMMQMTPNTPTGYTAAYSLNPTSETHGAFYRRLVTGDVDTGVTWPKPPGWRHFMHAVLTVRGVSPISSPTGGSLTVAHIGGDTTATVTSVTVPSAGTMVFMLGTVAVPRSSWPTSAVALGVPTGWTHLAATDKSGRQFYAYDTNPSLVVVAKSFASAGTTGSVVFPTAQGGPAFAGLWTFLTPAADVSATIGAV